MEPYPALEKKSNINIVEVIGRYISLRRSGRQYLGRCIFHDDKNPSFSVSEEKQVYHCFGCAESGDVIDFIMKHDGLTFPEALRALGIESNGPRPAPRVSVSPNRKAAALLAEWLNYQHLLVGARCREVSQEIKIAEEIPDDFLARSFRIEWEILCDLHEDLQNPKLAQELWDQRQAIEQITADVELEPLEEFPPLTESYRAYLRRLVEKC